MNKTISFSSIKGANIHKIDQFGRQKDYAITIGTKTFHYCREQLIFLSRKALHHFNSSIYPFEIQIDQIKNSPQISIEELTSSFLLLDSLFQSENQIKIDPANVNSLSLLAEILDNSYLFSKCEKVYSNQPQSFSFNFKQLQFLPSKTNG
jgi:hypothetical protein